jgi:hypothetical protein
LARHRALPFHGLNAPKKEVFLITFFGDFYCGIGTPSRGCCNKSGFAKPKSGISPVFPRPDCRAFATKNVMRRQYEVFALLYKCKGGIQRSMLWSQRTIPASSTISRGTHSLTGTFYCVSACRWALPGINPTVNFPAKQGFRLDQPVFKPRWAEAKLR